MATKRIYAIQEGERVRLVRASHPNAALMHVARGTYATRVATQTDLERAFKAGIQVEEPDQKAAGEGSPS